MSGSRKAIVFRLFSFHSREVLRIIRLLQEAGIEAIPLKGSLFSDVVLGDLGIYPTSDIDLLVRPHGWLKPVYTGGQPLFLNLDLGLYLKGYLPREFLFLFPFDHYLIFEAAGAVVIVAVLIKRLEVAKLSDANIRSNQSLNSLSKPMPRHCLAFICIFLF